MKPLNGIKVLDLSRLLPGSFISLMLADYGADVVMVEHPDGESGRHRGPFIKNLSTRHLLLNRNKKSITLDIRKKRGQDLLRQLAIFSDVLVENFRPGFMNQNGLGYSHLSEHNSRLIFCSLTGYGQTGVDRDKPGHDINYLSETGILGLSSREGDKLNFPGVQIADIGGSMMAVTGILLSIIAREHTGKGQHIDISITDSLTSWLHVIYAQSLAGGKLPGPGEYIFAGHLACYNTYKTKDGRYVSLGAVEPKFWAALCKWISCEEFIPYQMDPSQQTKIKARLQEIFISRTLSEWISADTNHDMCLTPVKTVEEALSDPRLIERNMIFRVEHSVAGMINQIGFPIKLSETPAKYDHGAPLLGQHNEEIYSTLGLSSLDLEILRKDGVI